MLRALVDRVPRNTWPKPPLPSRLPVLYTGELDTWTCTEGGKESRREQKAWQWRAGQSEGVGVRGRSDPAGALRCARWPLPSVCRALGTSAARWPRQQQQQQQQQRTGLCSPPGCGERGRLKRKQRWARPWPAMAGICGARCVSVAAPRRLLLALTLGGTARLSSSAFSSPGISASAQAAEGCGARRRCPKPPGYPPPAPQAAPTVSSALPQRCRYALEAGDPPGHAAPGCGSRQAFEQPYPHLSHGPCPLLQLCSLTEAQERPGGPQGRCLLA